MSAIHQTQVPWTDDERKQARQLWENGLGAVKIGRLMGRSYHSVSKQLKLMGLHRPFVNPKVSKVIREPPRRDRAGLVTLPPLPSLSNE